MQRLKNFDETLSVQLPKQGYSYSEIFVVGFAPWRIKAFAHVNNTFYLEPEMECMNLNVVISSKVEISLVSFREGRKGFCDLTNYDERRLKFQNGFYVLPWSVLQDRKLELVKNGWIQVKVKMSVDRVSIKN